MSSGQKLSSEAVKVLSLYKKILRLHQYKLPEVPRAIGDKYVRQEFRAHRNVTPQQKKQFILQWTEYIAHLTTEADIFGLGRDLPQDEIDGLNEQQQEQLKKIHNNAMKVNPDGTPVNDDNQSGDTQPSGR